MAENEKTVQISEGQGCSQTLSNAAVAKVQERQQGCSQTSQNVQQALATVANQNSNQGKKS